MNKDYRKSGNRVHNLNLHIVFCPKYRRKCLTGDVAKRCEELLREKCAELDCEVSALEIMPDHVHLILTTLADENGSFSIPQIMHAIKSESAHRINRALGRKGKVWQDESFDHVLRGEESLASKVA